MILMKRISFALLFLIVTFPAMAQVEPDYNSTKPFVTTPWYGQAGAAQKQADLKFIKDMHPHHAGALSMSREYLDNPKAKNDALQALARGIIRNQAFEIHMLDTVEALMKSFNPPATGTVRTQIATRGLAQKARFRRAPMPASIGNGIVSAEDVRFAKAMIVHHEGALVMARDYLNDPAADNGYLRLMCTDILRDQAREIAFMHDVIAAYPGDEEAIKIDPSMVHGMEGMNHAGGHHGHH